MKNFHIEKNGNTYNWIDTELCSVGCNGFCNECPKTIKYEVTITEKE